MNDCTYNSTSYMPLWRWQGNLYLLFVSRMLTLGSIFVKNAQVRNGHRLNTGRNWKVGELREVPSLILRWLYRQVPFFCPHRKRGCSTCCRGNNCTVIRAPGGTGFRQYVCTALGVRCGKQHANSLPTNWLLKRSGIRRIRHSFARFTVLVTVSSGMPMIGTAISEELGAYIFRE